MPRRRRSDFAGAWHHVMSRAIARRTLFETRADIRYFLSRLAREVRRGDLEIHAYSVLTTHFHLLARSPRGRLSSAMQRALDAYARWFNRTRRRDGPLFRGRFVNRIVDTDAYWLAVLLYIDRNPVDARLVERAADHSFGSAQHYERGGGPPWLSKSEVEARLGAGSPSGLRPGEYSTRTLATPASALAWVAARRIETDAGRRADEPEDLLGAAPERVRVWMERKAQLADGTKPGVAVASPTAILDALRARPLPEGLGLPRSEAPVAEVLAAGLLRVGCGLTIPEIAERLRTSAPVVRRRLRVFAGVARSPHPLSKRVMEAAAQALEASVQVVGAGSGSVRTG